MADSRFFKKPAPVSITEIVDLTGAQVHIKDGQSVEMSHSFDDVAPLDRAASNEVSFLDNVKYADIFTQTKAGACFIKSKFIERAPKDTILFVSDDPYTAYAILANHLYQTPPHQPAIAPNTTVAPSATIGGNVRLDSGVSIGENATIGNNTHIGANTVIDDGVVIGDNCQIGALCSISHSVIGDHVKLHRGIHIGQDGFGFAPSKTGIIKVPQLGRVMIGNHVEIGSGTCIDRGAGPDTTIGNHCKIDNLVQIGHNVQIGNYAIIVSQAGLAGSSIIGDGAMIGGQVGLSGHISIGAGAKVAAKSGVMHNIPPGSTYGGAPAIPIKEWHRQTVAITKLTKKQ